MDLRTSYLGMTLGHPFIAGASPFGYHLDTIKRLEDAGCAAVVLHSLFEEQITDVQSGHIAHMDVFDDRFRETLSVFPAAKRVPVRARRIRRARAAREAGRQHSRHRFAERTHAGIVAEVCADHRAGRRRRAGAEHVRGPGRPFGARHRDRRSVGRRRQRPEASAEAFLWPSSCRRSSPPLATWRIGSIWRVPTVSCCSTASINRTSTFER